MSRPIAFDKEYVFRRYVEEKATADDIAAEYDCSNVAVLNFIRRNGGSIRTLSEAQRTTRLDAYQLQTSSVDAKALPANAKCKESKHWSTSVSACW